ncbi:MAG: hypothetical protein ACE1YX_04120, partial [Nitrosopumilaceae archaeon]
MYFKDKTRSKAFLLIVVCSILVFSVVLIHESVFAQIELNATMFVLPSAPSFVSLVISDPDGLDAVYSNGDVITASFDKPTSRPFAATKEDLLNLFTFSRIIGNDFTGSWDSASVLKITIVDVGAAADPLAGGLFLTVNLGGDLRDETLTSSPSTDKSDALIGSVGDRIGPSVTDFFASDPDDDDAIFNALDELTFRFSEDTNTPPVALQSDIDAIFDFTPALEATYSGSFANARTLVVTIDSVPIVATPPEIGTFFATIKASGGLTSAPPDVSLPSEGDTQPLSGTFGQGAGPDIVLVSASDPVGNDDVYGEDDRITVSLNVPTSGPELFGGPDILSEENLDSLFIFSTSLGSGHTGKWSDSQTLEITVGTPPPAPDPIPEIGSFSLTVKEIANLQDIAKTSLPSVSGGLLTGDFGIKPGPGIVFLGIDDPDASDIVLSALDEVTVSFDVATSQPEVATKPDLDFVFGGLPVFGSDYTGKWTDPFTLLITIQNPDGGSPVIGMTTIFVKESGNLQDSGKTSRAAVGVSPVLEGSLGEKAAPLILAVIAHDPKDIPIPGHDNGDTITVIFSERTNLVNPFDTEKLNELFTFSQAIGDEIRGVITPAGDLVIEIIDGELIPQKPVVNELQITPKIDAGIQAEDGSLNMNVISPVLSGNFGGFMDESFACGGGSTFTSFPAGITTQVTIPGITCGGLRFEEADQDTPDRIEIIGEAFSITSTEGITCTIPPFCAIVVIFSQEQIPLDDDGTPIDPITEVKIFKDGEDPDD